MTFIGAFVRCSKVDESGISIMVFGGPDLKGESPLLAQLGDGGQEGVPL